MTSRRSRVAALAAFTTVLAVPSAAFAAPSAPAVSEPTSRGEAVVGFVRGLPAGLAPGATLGGHPVVSVDAGGAFAVVEASDVADVRADVANVPGVRYVEDNVTKTSLVTPNDAQYGSQYGPNLMGFPTAWGQVGYGTSSVTVSVIDTGIRRTHQDLTGRVLQGYDYVNKDSDPADDCDHGTHVSGTVAATTNNAVGVAGMSQATILPYKVLDRPDILGRCSGSAANIASAIRAAADNGAKIISMSIGGPDSTVERDAVVYAYNKGVTLVAAAGNDGGNNSIDYPGAYSEVIAVGAVTSTKARASYSDGGPQLDIVAPGSDVLSTIDNSDSAYGTMSGTSMATPHVAGALALAMSCAPSVSRATLTSTLYSTAEDLGAAGRDDIYGAGLARIDRVVANLCSGSGPANTAPVASFTTSVNGLTASVNGTGSTDADGDPLTYSWSWGDNTANGSGATASHTYAAAGTYTVTLTVNDGRGGTNSTTRTVTVSPTTTTDPDPATPNLTSGQQVNVTISGAGDEKFFKIQVPTGKSQLQVVMTGPACGLLGCSFDADLYTRLSARPTDTVYTCRPFQSGSNETCTHASPAAGYWYVRVDGYTGSGTVTLKATVS